MTYTANSQQWREAEQLVRHARVKCLYGPPGTGKTTIGYSDGNTDAVKLACTEELSVAEIIGHYVPVKDRFLFMPGAALLAWTRGLRLIIDEIDRASGPALQVLLAVLDGPYTAALTIPDPAMAGWDDEQTAKAILDGTGLITVKPEPTFNCLATMNGEPEDLDDALRDRFQGMLKITEPHPDAVNSLPEDLRKAAWESACLTDYERRIGIRRYKAFADLRPNMGEDLAAKCVFNGRHRDVLAALRLSRGANFNFQPNVQPEPVKSEPVEQPGQDGRVDTSKYPVSYALVLKGRGRGKPPAPVCPEHGKTTGRAAVEKDDGLHCKECDRLVAVAGKYRVRVKFPDGWADATRDGDGQWVKA